MLVVDDDARVRRALHDLIDAAGGMQVVATAGGVGEALEVDAHTAPVVALVDVLLPDRADGVVATSVSAAVGKDALAACAPCDSSKRRPMLSGC